MSAFHILALIVVGAVTVVVALAIRADWRTTRERRADRKAAAAHRRDVAATKAADLFETDEQWFKRTGAEPTRKERA
jgi:uncharacterized protein YpmB